MSWRCAWCGKSYEERNPPCDVCGYNAFEPAETPADSKTVDTGPAYVWECPNCGRNHPKNNPPCSRCGNPELEKTIPDYEDIEADLDVPSWIDVAKPYSPILIVVVLIVALFATGIVPLSVLPGIGTPDPPDAPGEGDQAAGLNLELTATELHEYLNANRSVQGESRTYDEGLAALATYENRRQIANSSADPATLDDFGVRCESDPVATTLHPLDTDVTSFDTETALAQALGSSMLSSDARELFLTGYDREGIDVHVDSDGTVVVFYIAC